MADGRQLALQGAVSDRRGSTLSRRNIRKHRGLLLMLVPALVYYVVFHYVPMYGAQIAFRDYAFLKGIWGSPWVGWENFRLVFGAPSFWEVFRNTLVISLMKLVVAFPAPIVFAILLNELNPGRFKKTVQTISYLPHFLSWVVLGGVFIQVLSPSIGPINILLRALGMRPIFFLGDPDWFRPTLVVTHVWQTIGWGSIVYLASIAGINPELYEASTMDGANRFQNMVYITLPGLAPVITIMFIFAVGRIINDDFDQVFNLYNPAVYGVGDVISTYVYRRGLEGLQFSFATAVGLFRNVLGFCLLILTNFLARRLSEYGLW